MRRRTLWTAALASAVLIGLGACGGDDGGDGNGDSATTLTLSAVDNKFDPAELSVAAGESVTVKFENSGENPHTFTAEDLDADTGVVDPGDDKSVTFTAPDSETEFVCSIHVGQGMVGTIVPE